MCRGRREVLLMSVEWRNPPAGTRQAVKNILCTEAGHACAPPEMKPAHAEPAPASPQPQHTEPRV